MNRYRKHGHYYETSANCLLPNLTQFLPRGAGAMLLILSGPLWVLQTTSVENGKTPWDYPKNNEDHKNTVPYWRLIDRSR